MTHPIEPSTLLTFCHRSDGPAARSILRVADAVYIWNDFEVFLVDAESLPFEELTMQALDAEKYLDQFLLLLPRNDPDRHLAVIEGFFSYISDQYESLIDSARNLGNIRVLTTHLRQVLSCGDGVLHIIDFGCGTGLSVDVDPSLMIIGVDRCPEMRSQAAARGMKTLGMAEFATLPHHSFHGAFASYVLHLLPPEQDLEALWERIKPGGAFTANFHKDRGIDTVVPILARIGADVRFGEPSVLSRVHGSYITFYKPNLEPSVRNSA